MCVEYDPGKLKCDLYCGEINIYSDNVTREKICTPRANTEE